MNAVPQSLNTFSNFFFRHLDDFSLSFIISTINWFWTILMRKSPKELTLDFHTHRKATNIKRHVVIQWLNLNALSRIVSFLRPTQPQFIHSCTSNYLHTKWVYIYQQYLILQIMLWNKVSEMHLLLCSRAVVLPVVISCASYCNALFSKQSSLIPVCDLFTLLLKSVHLKVLHCLIYHQLALPLGNRTFMLQLLTLIFIQEADGTSSKHTAWISKYFLLNCLHTWKEQHKVFNVPSLIMFPYFFWDA